MPVEVVLQAVPGAEGRPRRYVKIVRDIRQRLETEERLRRVQQDLRLVEDRERIARDLHDIVIQKLFAAGMTIQGVWSRTTEPDQARRLSSVVDDLDDTIREIRSVIFSLQSNRADGLRSDILRIVSEERLVLGFEPRVRFEGPVDTISESVATELLATLREALSNVGASRRSVNRRDHCGVRRQRLPDCHRRRSRHSRNRHCRQRDSQPHRACHVARWSVPRRSPPRRWDDARVAGPELSLVAR